MNKVIETHFTNEELDCKCGCGLSVRDDFLILLEALRAMVGLPLPISSGARCDEYNKKIGGVENSRHIFGVAVDITCTTSEFRSLIIRSAIALGMYGFGIAEGFVHIDIRHKDRSRLWLYGA